MEAKYSVLLCNQSLAEYEKKIEDWLRKCNRDLITSINEVVRIHEQGAQKRVQVHEELVKIEEELKQAMLEAGSR